MLNLKDFKQLKLVNENMLFGGSTITDGGSRSGTKNGKEYCFTYTSDCSETDPSGQTTIRFCGIVDC